MKNFFRWQYKREAETPPELITPDKWIPQSFNVQNPTRKKRIIDFFIKFSGGPERATIDKWGFQLPSFIPKFVLATALIPALFLTEVVADVEEVTVDKWFVQASEPVRNTPPLVQEGFFSIDPVQLTQPERTTVDKWFVELQRPPKIRRPIVLHEFAQPPPQSVVDGQSNFRWESYQPQIVFDKARIQYTYQSLFFDPEPITVAEPDIPLDRWDFQEDNPKLRRKISIPYRFGFQSGLETITPDKWIGQYPDVIFDKQRNQYTYPYFFADAQLHEVPVTEITSVDKWFVQYHNPVLPKESRWTYPDLFIDSELLTKPERTTVDKWFVQYNNPTLPGEYRQTYPYLFSDPEIQPKSIIEDLGWRPELRDLPIPKQDNRWTYPYFFIDSNQLTQGERITPDKWLPVYPDIIFDRERNQYLYPSFFAEDLFEVPGIEDVTVDKWFVQYFNPILEKDLRWTFPYFSIDPVQLTQSERITLDKWHPFTPDIVFDKPRNQYLYPSFFAEDLFKIPGIEEITPDKWFIQVSEPVRIKPPKPLEGYAEPPSVDALEAEKSQYSWRPEIRELPIPTPDIRWTYPYLFLSDIQPKSILEDLGWNRTVFDNPTLPQKQPSELKFFFEPPFQSVQNGISQLGWRPNFYDNPVLPRDNRWTYPYLAIDAKFGDVPIPPASIDADAIGIDLYIDQNRSIDLNIVMAPGIDLYIDPDRSIDLER